VLILLVTHGAMGQAVARPVGEVNPRHMEVAQEMVRRALSDTVGYHLLRQLAAIGPRLVGSPASMQAIRWAERTMRQLGLEGVRLQEVTVPHWERGEKEVAEVVSPKQLKGKRLHVAALGGSVATPSGGTRGQVIEVRGLEELRARQDEVRGKIVFFNRPMEVHLVDTFAAYGRAVDQRVQGPAEAGKAGAVGVIVRSVTTKPDNVPHVGTLHYGEAPRLPAVAIGLQDADRLAGWLHTYGQVEALLRLSCRDLGRTLSYNVIGELRGRELPEEVVAVGGHFDSWDQGDGAHDDGAGCVQALEVLDLLKRVGLRPRRTVRVVFFVNEEFGLDGARAYAEQAAASAECHLAAIESDRGAFTPRGFFVDAADSIVARMQDWLPLLNQALVEWVRKGGSGADIAQLKGTKALIGYVPDTQRYFDYHHSANDVFAAVHPREFELGAAAMAILAYLIAEEGL
jgi:hypothetical protein